MKVAFQVEGDLDLEVFRKLVEVLIEEKVEDVKYVKRTGGVGEVFRTLEKSVWAAWSAGCRGMVLSVDADHTARHAEHADEPGDCRFCEVHRRLSRLSALPDASFKFAVAVPVEAIEAWLLHFGHIVGRRPAGPPQRMGRHDAKRLLWGDMRPARVEIDAVLGAILPKVAKPDLDALKSQQPSFADFADAIGTWKSP